MRQVTGVHIQECTDVQQIEVGVGAELQADTLAQVAARWGIQGCADYEEMLQRAELDIA